VSTNFTTWAFRDGKNRKKLNRQVPQILFICGLPGSGKSTLGKKLANKLKFRFIDLDIQVLDDTGISPAQWISEYSEDDFRINEAQALRNIKTDENLIVSCGGGTPCFEQNLEWMLEHGTCIYLDVPEGMVLNRLQQGEVGNRPLINQVDPLVSLRALIEKRKECYARIPHRIEPHRLSFAELINWVREKINEDYPR
jgi:shikimate kinase